MSLWDRLPTHLQADIVERAFRMEVDEAVEKAEKEYGVRFLKGGWYGKYYSKLDYEEQFELNYNAIREALKVIPELYQPRKLFNYTFSSYGVKHVIERRLKGYVANGEAIIAMIMCGYKFKFLPDIHPNGVFNMTIVKGKSKGVRR